MSTAFPLPNGFFDTNHKISEELRRQYIEFAESSIRKVFALSDCHKNSWIPVREKKGVAVYRNFCQKRGAKAYKSNITEVGGKGEFHASLEEIGRAYAAHDDALFRRLMKKINPGTMDSAVLFNIVPRTPMTPFRYIGIKWFAVKTPTPLVSHRDYCCLEVQDKIVDSFGNEMYIRVLNSIDINECPSLENSHGLVRAKMLAGFMYRRDRSEPSLIRAHHVARYDPCGYFPSQWAYKSAESELINSVVQIRRIIEKQQMNACTFVDKRQWVPNDQRQQCAVCNRTFGTFRPRHHCRCCGEVICGKCSVFRCVDVPGTSLKNVRICSVCNMGVQKSSVQTDGDNMSDISTSSITSSSTIAQNEMNMMDLYLSANNPGTPSAYSNTSTQSNLSIRSTASSRSVLDVRGRAQSSHFSHHRQQSRVNACLTPVHRTTAASGSFFNDSNTPRSYMANQATTPRGFSSDDCHTPSATAQRMSAYRQNPLDIGYLRESVRTSNKVPPTEASNQEPEPAAALDSSEDQDMEDVSADEAHVASAAKAHQPATAMAPAQHPTKRDRPPMRKQQFFGGFFAQ
ncbi:TPA: hypothetical protein N0F65_012353 [Lagenidium giganteum]|uniref:FYVE-type domain-containing protein n=1 Tax=Lagenidium giganteum TaxID=4803 RepID=A0AAV2YLS5_9STRA|nr:TPA: hypothetical protein N0F65_012353 [Lagenidium giganteum]